MLKYNGDAGAAGHRYSIRGRGKAEEAGKGDMAL